MDADDEVIVEASQLKLSDFEIVYDARIGAIAGLDCLPDELAAKTGALVVSSPTLGPKPLLLIIEREVLALLGGNLFVNGGVVGRAAL